MSREQMRRDITAKIEEVLATLNPKPLIEYDNAMQIDLSKQKDVWLSVNIRFIDAEQMELAENPHQRFYGQIELAGVQKEFSGSSKALALTDIFYKALQRKKFGVIQTHMAIPAKDQTVEGWAYFPILVPFWSDQAT